MSDVAATGTAPAATPLPEEKICIPALSPGFNQRAVVGAISEAAAFCFHLDGDGADQVETLSALKRSACVGQVYDSYEEARQSLVLCTCKPQFDATIASLVKRCADRGDDNVTKAVSKAIRVMSEHRNVLPDEAPKESAPTTIPRPPVTTELVEPVVLPEPGLPFNVTLKDASWFKKEHCAYVQIDTDRAALVTVFSVSDAHVITLTHAIAQCAGMTIAAGSKISIRNECGEWDVAEAGKVAVLEPSAEHWTWRIWKASCVSQKSAIWKGTSSTIDALPGTMPSATVHAHQLYVASISPAYTLEVRVYACSGSFRQPDSIITIAIGAQTSEPLKLSVHESMLAVCGSHAVYVVTDTQDETSAVFVHTIVHPTLQAAGQTMITSCLMRNAEQLVLGTALGCVWNVHPTQRVLHRFFPTVKVLPITHLAADGEVLAAGCVNEVFLMPDEADFVRGVAIACPIDFVLRDRLLIAYSKYGPCAFLDVQGELEPCMYPAPAEPYTTAFVLPCYPALCLSGGEGRLLSALYADGRVKVIKMK